MKPESTTPRSPKEFVLTFLQSVGRPRDAEFYLRLFQDLPKSSFAVVAAEAEVFERAIGLVAEPIRFLGQLDLYPILAVNLLDSGADAHPRRPADANQLVEVLTRTDVDAELFSLSDVAPVGAELALEITHSLEDNTLPVVDFHAVSDRYAALSALLEALHTRRLALLRPQGGLGPKEPGLMRLTGSHELVLSARGISVINLRSDLDALRSANHLPAHELQLLEDVKRLHDRNPTLSTSITSPLDLLSELFTVKGAGTLVKTGSSIQRQANYENVDLGRLTALLESTFSRKLRTEFWQHPPLHVYLEQDYRGAAITQPGPANYPADSQADQPPVFLTKFAVNRAAQGEGIGRDLWEAVTRDQRSLYWRARSNNPVTPWYAQQCDGMQRNGEWQVFWRGVRTEQIADIVADALQRPIDFETD